MGGKSSKTKRVSSVGKASATTATTQAAPPRKELPKNIILVGDSGVGKSSLLLRFYTNEFTSNEDELREKTTVGTDFIPYKATLPNGREVDLHLWDTGGQERFSVMTASYYRGANCVLCVYDVTNSASLETIPKYCEEVRRYAKNPNVVLLLIGNKSDLKEKQVVSIQKAKEIWTKIGGTGQVLEASAKDGTNVREAFLQWL